MIHAFKQSFLLSSIALFAAFALSVTTANAAFLDVPPEHLYYEDITYLVENGIVPDGSFFAPDELIILGDLARWSLLNSGFDPESYTPRPAQWAADVPETHPYAPYIYKMIEFGFLSYSPYSEKIHVNQPVSRLKALQTIFSLEGIPAPRVFEEAAYPFTDLGPSSPFAHIFLRAAELGTIDSVRARPFARATRGEVAHMLRMVKQNTTPATITITIGNENAAEHEVLRSPKFSIFLDTWDKAVNTFIDRGEIDKNELMYGAIEGLVKELDDKYSEFTRPGENGILTTLENEIEGIGAVITSREGKIIIISPLSNSPAERAGLKPNDEILAVDGESVADLTLNQAVNRIKGPAGTDVTLKISRGGTELTITVTREKITIIPVQVEFTDDNIALLTINDFGITSVAAFTNAAEQIIAAKPNGIAMDLRNNPGGFLDAAVKIAGHFVEPTKTIARLAYPTQEISHKSPGSADLAKFPLVVLVNNGSASASEILAGSIQDHGIGKIIGTQTFGKGSVQELTEYTDGSSLKITVAKWLTPNGTDIEGTGVTPDIAVTDYSSTPADEQLDRALQELRGE